MIVFDALVTEGASASAALAFNMYDKVAHLLNREDVNNLYNIKGQ